MLKRFTKLLMCETNIVGETQNDAIDFLDHSFLHSDHKNLLYEQSLSLIKTIVLGEILPNQVGSFYFLLPP